MNVWSNEKYCDLANLVLGAVLFLSPWVLGFAAGAQSQNAWITGIVIAVLSIAALAAFAEWEEWLNLVAGLWAIAAPWVLMLQALPAQSVRGIVDEPFAGWALTCSSTCSATMVAVVSPPERLSVAIALTISASRPPRPTLSTTIEISNSSNMNPLCRSDLRIGFTRRIDLVQSLP